MTTPETQEPAATQGVSVGVLPPAIRQALELRKLQNAVAGQIAGMTWGKSLDLATRRALADWGRTFRVDVTTEIHILGGNVYLNAQFYLRRLAQMIEKGLVEYAYADHVEDDERLTRLGDEGVGETNRRLRERIAYQIPDKAASAVVFRVKLRNMAKEITGAKWCGNGTRQNDPVGDKFPVESAESRAARRAIRQMATHVPDVAADITTVEDSAEDLSDRVGQAIATATVMDVKNRIEPSGVAAGPANDPYSLHGTSEVGEAEAELGL